MHPKKLVVASLVGAALAVAACDDDPTAPDLNFALSGCPTGDLAVNQPISLNFTSAVNPATVSGANVIVTNASTGFEIPGGLSIAPNGNQVLFTPSAPLPFGTALSIRVQNLLNAQGTASTGVTVCNVLTQAAPITELVWDRLPPVSGGTIAGASLFAPDSGWVADFGVPIFRRVGSGWEVRFNQPYFQSTSDVDFVSPVSGWAAHFDQRNLRGVFTRTTNGGVTWDTLLTVAGQAIGRIRIDSALTGGRLFGLSGGGSFAQTWFFKLDPATGGWRTTSTFASGFGSTGTSQVNDVDFSAQDTTLAAAVTRGVRINASTTIFIPGRIYRSTNSGESWAEIPGTAADSAEIVTYQGVAVRRSGDIFVSGGNGFLGRIAPNGNTLTRIELPLESRDSTNYQALTIADVQFAPDNDMVGWAIGSQLLGVTNGVPRRVGLIFRTTDGGATWVRQGVRGADDYGATFPALFRIEALSSTDVWITGSGGLVLTLRP